MPKVFEQAQQLLLHPASHALLALILAAVALFALVRHYYKARLFRQVATPAISLGVLFYMELQLGFLYATKAPHHWLFGRDLPVYLLLALTGAFAVLGVWELVARRTWQGCTNLMLATGTSTLGAELTMYAYGWDKLGTTIVIAVLLLATLTMAVAAIGSYRSRLRPARAI